MFDSLLFDSNTFFFCFFLVHIVSQVIGVKWLLELKGEEVLTH